MDGCGTFSLTSKAAAVVGRPGFIGPPSREFRSSYSNFSSHAGQSESESRRKSQAKEKKKGSLNRL